MGPDIFSVSNELRVVLSALNCRGSATVYLDREDFERVLGSLHGSEFASYVTITTLNHQRAAFQLNGVTFRRRLLR
jgi:hypothetical protein